MFEPRTALQGAHFSGDITVTDAGLVGMIAIRGDLTDPALCAAVAQVTGHPVPVTRKMSGDATDGLAWMSADELMLFCAYGDAPTVAARLVDALGDVHSMVSVLSDARAVIRLHGDVVREVLAKGAPVDLAPDQFAQGDIRRSRLGQVAVAFWMMGPDSAELVCFRSVAGFVFEWLSTASQSGSAVGYFATPRR